MLIAHRGASGYLPENTFPAFALAHAMGADSIEIDLVMSRDRVPVVFHDLTLEGTTNVRDLFPDRARADGRWYVLDFGVEEIKRLEVRERYGNRFRQDSRGFQIPTFEEVLQLVQELNRTTVRDVGLHVELKAPSFHRGQGGDLEAALLASLDRNRGRSGPPSVTLVASEAESLKRLRFELGASLPLVQLLDAPAVPFDAMASPRGLDAIAGYANAVGPEKGRIEVPGQTEAVPSPLVQEAHARGLGVLPFTLRADDFPTGSAAFEEQLERFFFLHGVDGIFTDFPDRAARILARGNRRPRAA